MAKIKYMGTSDIRVLPKGEDFGGQLAEPLTKEVRFTPQNNHVVDTDEAGLSQEAVDLLLAVEGVVYGEADLVEPDESTARTIKEFKDVSDLKVIPPSLHQSTYLGLKGVKNKDAEEDPEGDDEPTEGEAKTEARAKKVRSSSATAGGTTAGGNTGGQGGDTGGSATTGGGAAGSSVGGNTGGAGGDA